MDRMFGVLNAGWAEVVPMQLQRQRLESQPQFANFLSEDCRVGGFEFAVTLGSHEAGLGIYYQMDMLQALESSCYPALSRTDAGHAATGTGQAWSHQLRHKLQSAQLELVAEFAEFQLSIADLISLQKGDIIPISSPRELTARIGDRAVFACGFGLSQGRHAVRIEQKLTGLSAWDDQQGGAQAPLDNQGKETGHD
jgi:flagellar motor switch protein FliM